MAVGQANLAAQECIVEGLFHRCLFKAWKEGFPQLHQVKMESICSLLQTVAGIVAAAASQVRQLRHLKLKI